jgi:thiazole synthase
MTHDSLPGDEPLVLGKYSFRSRLLVGTGKYRDPAETRAALAATGAEVVTLAVRRVDLDSPNGLLDVVDPDRYTLLPNTAGCYTADDAIRTARLAREALGTDFVKLEVIGDPRTLFPDVVETIRAAEILVKEGFTVLPYTSDDLVVARKLIDVGCPAVMPLAAPIGSGLGVRNPFNIRILVEELGAPIIVDAGVGTASHAARAMELGVDAVLMNTGIAAAGDAVRMAHAMRLAVLAGRHAFLAGPMKPRLHAAASSPLDGLID